MATAVAPKLFSVGGSWASAAGVMHRDARMGILVRRKVMMERMSARGPQTKRVGLGLGPHRRHRSRRHRRDMAWLKLKFECL